MGRTMKICENHREMLMTVLFGCALLACGDQRGPGARTLESVPPASPPPSETQPSPTLRPALQVASEPPPTSPFLVGGPAPAAPTPALSLATPEPKPLPPPPPSPTWQSSRCPPGTCARTKGGPCERPTGQLGNGCCSCGNDGFCSSFCRCNGPDVPIATPNGPKRIADIHVGDWVYSTNGNAIVVAPVEEVRVRPAPPSGYVRVEFEDGTWFISSSVHPLANGDFVENMGKIPGVRSVAPASSSFEYTYDIAVASEDGGYFVGDILFATTLRPVGVPRR